MAQIIVTIPLGRERESSFDEPESLSQEIERMEKPYGFIDRKTTNTTADIAEIIAKTACEQVIKLNKLIKKTKNMKELDLVKKLKNAPEGLKLYSPLVGDVTLVEVLEPCNYPISVDGIDGNYRFASNGKYCNPNQGECLLFPSKECRNWDDFEIIEEPKFKTNDIVIVNGEIRRVDMKNGSGYLTYAYGVDCARYADVKDMKLATKEELRDNYCLMLDKDKNLVRWMPKENEHFWYINVYGESVGSTYHDKTVNNNEQDFNYFPTKETAKQAAKEMTENFKNFNPKK